MAFVLVPAGVFVTGSFNLTSQVYLCLEDGAEVRGSDSGQDYVLVDSITSDTGPFDYPLVFVYNATQTGILGSGAGDGVQGRVNGGLNDPPGNHISRYDPTLNFLYPTEWDLPFCIYFSCRPKLLVARLSTDLVFTGLSLANSALWTFTLSESSGIVVDSVHVSGSRQYPNNDGLDCISCSHLTVSNSAFSTGDDNLALISHGPSTMSNLTLANLTLSSTSAAIKLSVYEAAASGSVTGVRVSNVSITDTNRGICLDPRWGAGSIMDVEFANMTIETHFFSTAWWGAAEPISVTAAWQSSDHPWTGTVAGLSFTGISMHSESGMFFYANQSQGVSALQGISIEDCTLLVDRFSNISAPQWDFRPSESPQQVFNVSLAGLYVDGSQEVLLSNSKIAFNRPLQPFYGDCVVAAPGSSVTEASVVCNR